MTLVVFSSALVVQGVRQNLETVRARLGADILVVPDDAGSEFDAQTALIQAEPGYFYMGADVLGRVAATPSVERASAQLFLASTRESRQLFLYKLRSIQKAVCSFSSYFTWLICSFHFFLLSKLKNNFNDKKELSSSSQGAVGKKSPVRYGYVQKVVGVLPVQSKKRWIAQSLRCSQRAQNYLVAGQSR